MTSSAISHRQVKRTVGASKDALLPTALWLPLGILLKGALYWPTAQLRFKLHCGKLPGSSSQHSCKPTDGF